MASIASSLEMKDSFVVSSFNITLPENTSMEGVMDEAYTYGRYPTFYLICIKLHNRLSLPNNNILENLIKGVILLYYALA